MVTIFRSLIWVLCVVIFASTVSAQQIANWPAPATWSPHSASRGLSAMDSITSPLPFIGVTPCRIVDTRNAVGPFGGPAFASAETRTYTIPAGPCSGIPVAAAYSLNFTAVNMIGVGFLTTWPAGTAQPLVSTLDYAPVEGAIANAAVVPTGSGGAINVYVALGTNVIIDINGYYAPAGVGAHNTFLGLDAGNFTMTGNSNTAIGNGALFNNTTGGLNTATGASALSSNTTGNVNTATGAYALSSNTTGFFNTATGRSALTANTAGSGNTATGESALLNNTIGGSNTATGNLALLNNTTGDGNTATGVDALISNVSGISNTASGFAALSYNVSGNANTAIGVQALGNTTGSLNIGIGSGAGFSLTTGSNNI